MTRFHHQPASPGISPAPNLIMEGRGFYVSYNNVDGDIYGCATTALVRG